MRGGAAVVVEVEVVEVEVVVVEVEVVEVTASKPGPGAV